MKKAAKAWLYQVGLLDRAQKIYFNLKTFSPSVLAREAQYRAWDGPDGYPIPPPNFIYDVIACRWGAVFFDSGKLLVDDMEALLKNNQIELARFGTILDFGCGCGRLIRHLEAKTTASLHGTDYNADLIGWCQKHLPFARFSINELTPPLSSEDEIFDFIYARSIFTHLPEDLQLQWIEELRRVLKSGGYLYLTMHGQPLANGLTETQRAQFEAGELVVTYATVAGENLCSTFASPAFVESKLLDGFILVDFVEGRNQEHLRQDIYVLQKK